MDPIPSALSKKSFSLIELLVVIAMLAVLMSLLVPSLSGMTYRANTLVCTNNLKQIGSGISLYSEDNQYLYPHLGEVRTNPTVLGIWEKMLPYHGNDTLAMREAFMCPHVEDGWKARMAIANWGNYDEFPFQISDNSPRIPYNLYFNVQTTYTRIGYNNNMMTKVGDRWQSGQHLVSNQSRQKYSRILASDVVGHRRGNHIPIDTETDTGMVEPGGFAPASWTFSVYPYGNGNYLSDDLSVAFYDELHRNFINTTGDAGSDFQFPLESFSDE